MGSFIIMKIKGIMLLFLCLSIFMGISSVSAQGTDNVTSCLSDDLVTLDCVSNFNDLNKEVNNLNSGDILNIGKNYTYDKTTDNVTSITVKTDNVTINGNGFTIDAKNSAKFFIVKGKNVCIKNLNFINALDTKSRVVNETSTTEKLINGIPITTSVTKSIHMESPITWIGSNGVISNCTFNKNTGSIGGVINWSGTNGSISDSKFNNNRAFRAAGAVYSEKTLNINNCSFNNCSSVLPNETVIMNTPYINKLKKIYQVNLMGKKQDLVSAIYITNSIKNKNILLSKDLATSGNYVNQSYVLTLTQDLGDSTIYSRKFIFNNVKNINDILDKLFLNNYKSTYTLAKSINVTNQYDYSNVLVKYKASELKEQIYKKYGLQTYYEHCMLYGQKPSFTTALDVNFAKNYKYSPYCPWDISASGFNLVTVKGNNAIVSINNDDSAENKWMILDQKSVVIISDLTVGGFNRAIENMGGIMVLNNVKLTHNRMDYTFDRDWGAAILNLGIIICNNCTFSDNYAKYGGAIFNQGYLSFNNCTFFNNLAYKKGGDVCNSAGSGYKVDVKNTSLNLDYVEGLSADTSALIQVGSLVASFTVGVLAGVFTANVFVGMAAGAAIGALIGGTTAIIITSNNYDYRFDRLATGLEIVFHNALVGMLAGACGVE